MSYASQTLLEDRFGTDLLIQLTDRETPPTGAIDADTVTEALAATDAMIDGYLASRYTLPMSETPDLVQDLASTIAIYKLHRFMPDPKIAEDYKLAIKSLEGISGGTIRLSVAGIETPSSGETGARVTDRQRPMTAENLKGFI